MTFPNQAQLTQSQSPTTNHLSAQAHLCSLQRLHWRSCATVGQGSFRPNADANESGAKRPKQHYIKYITELENKLETYLTACAAENVKPEAQHEGRGKVEYMIRNLNALCSSFAATTYLGVVRTSCMAQHRDVGNVCS